LGDVAKHPLEGVAALHEGLELLGRIPGRVAVDANAAVGLDLHERLEPLAAGVLLDVSLEGLQRAVYERPGRRRHERDRMRRARAAWGCRDGQPNSCPQP